MPSDRPLILVALEGILIVVGHVCAICALPFHLFVVLSQKFASNRLFHDEINYVFYAVFWPIRLLCFILLIPMFAAVPGGMFWLLHFKIQQSIGAAIGIACVFVVVEIVGCVYISKREHLQNIFGTMDLKKLLSNLWDSVYDFLSAICFILSLGSIVRIPAILLTLWELGQPKDEGEDAVDLRATWCKNLLFVVLDLLTAVCLVGVVVTMWRLGTLKRRCTEILNQYPEQSTAFQLAYNKDLRIFVMKCFMAVLYVDSLFVLMLVFTVLTCPWRIPKLKQGIVAARADEARQLYHLDHLGRFFGYSDTILEQFGGAVLDIVSLPPLLLLMCTLYRLPPLIKTLCSSNPYADARDRRSAIWIETLYLGMDLLALLCMIPIAAFFLRLPRTLASIHIKALTLAYLNETSELATPLREGAVVPPRRTEPTAQTYIYKQALKSVRDFAYFLLGLVAVVFVWRLPLLLLDLWKHRSVNHWYRFLNQKQRRLCVEHAIGVFIDIMDMPIALVALIILMTGWRAKEYLKAASGSRMVWRIQTAIFFGFWLGDIVAFVCCIFVMITVIRAPSLIRRLKQRWMAKSDGSNPILSQTSFNILPSLNGLHLAVAGIKDPKVKISSVALTVEGEAFWESLKTILGGTTASVARSFLPLSLDNTMININAVCQETSECSFVICIGNDGKYKVLTQTIVEFLEKLQKSGNPEFTVTFNYLRNEAESGDTYEGVLFKLTTSASELLDRLYGFRESAPAEQVDHLEVKNEPEENSEASVKYQEENIDIPKDNIDIQEDNIDIPKDNIDIPKDNIDIQEDNIDIQEESSNIPKDVQDIKAPPPSQFVVFDVAPECFPNRDNSNQTSGRAKTWHLLVFKETLKALLGVPLPLLMLLTLWRLPSFISKARKVQGSRKQLTRQIRRLLLVTIGRTMLDVVSAPLVALMVGTGWRVPLLVKTTRKYNPTTDDEHLLVFHHFLQWLIDVPFAIVGCVVLVSWRSLGFAWFLLRQSEICGLSSPLAALYRNLEAKNSQTEDHQLPYQQQEHEEKEDRPYYDLNGDKDALLAATTTVVEQQSPPPQQQENEDRAYYNLEGIAITAATTTTAPATATSPTSTSPTNAQDLDHSLLSAVRTMVLMYALNCLLDIVAAVLSLCLVATIIRLPHVLIRCHRYFVGASNDVVATRDKYHAVAKHRFTSTFEFAEHWFCHSRAVHSGVIRTFLQLLSDVVTLFLALVIFAGILHVGCFFKKLFQMRQFGAWLQLQRHQQEEYGKDEDKPAEDKVQEMTEIAVAENKKMFEQARLAMIEEDEEDMSWPSLTPLRPMIATEALDSVRHFYHVIVLPLKVVGMLFLPVHMISHNMVKKERRKMDIIQNTISRFQRTFPNWAGASEYPEMRFDCIFAEYPVQVTEMLMAMQKELYPQDETTDRCVDIIRHALTINNTGRFMGAQHSAHFTILFYPLEWVVDICETRRNFWAFHEFAIAFALFGAVTIVNELALLVGAVNYAFAFLCCFGSPLWQKGEKYQSWRKLTQTDPLDSSSTEIMRGLMCVCQMVTLPVIVAVQLGLLGLPIVINLAVFGPHSISQTVIVVQIPWAAMVVIGWISSRRIILRHFPFYSPFLATLWVSNTIRVAYEFLLVSVVIWCYDNRRSCGCIGELLMFPVVIVWTGWPNIVPLLCFKTQPLTFIASGAITLMLIYFAAVCIKKNWDIEPNRPQKNRKTSVVPENREQIYFDTAAWQADLTATSA